MTSTSTIDTGTSSGAQMPETWADWIAANGSQDEDVKLNTLRDYIWQAAKDAHTDDPHSITAEWINKKLASVGVTARIDAVSTYTLRVPVSGYYTTEVSAPNRAEAERLFASMIGATRTPVREATATGPVEFTDGPEDAPAGAVSPDAPTTVDGTLVKLREIILLGVVAGPRYCVPGANDALADFGLGTVPDRKGFIVTRPVAGVSTTRITAYDEASALRVAEWRWASKQAGFTVREEDLTDTGDFAVQERDDDMQAG